MKRTVLISVYMNYRAKESNKPTFRRELVTDSSVSLNYNILLDAFKIIFGSNCTVTFEVVDFETNS